MAQTIDLGLVAGSQLLQTAGAPDAAVGLDGDWALDPANGHVYRKESGEWAQKGTFKVPALVNGKTPDEAGTITLTAGDVGAYSKGETDAELSGKVSKAGDTMAGDLDMYNKTLKFIIPGRYSYYLQNDGSNLRVSDHDGHLLLGFGYNSVPFTVGGAVLATATPPQEFDLPLAAGYVKEPTGYKSCLSKAQDGLVVLHVAVRMMSGENLAAGYHNCATIPVGYRPIGGVGKSSSDCAITVQENGNVAVWLATAREYAIFTVTYYAA